MEYRELQMNPDYKLLLTLQHQNLLPFLQEHLFSRTKTMVVFWCLNAGLLLWLIYEAILDFRTGLLSWVMLSQAFGIAIILLFTITIVLHEMVHGIAYKLNGAPRISFGVNWREFYFYAVADQFVLGRKAFTFVALSPFISISLGLIVSISVLGQFGKWILFFSLFLHTGACAGDFVMLSFFEINKKFKKMLTFDDVKAGLSYFYGKI